MGNSNELHASALHLRICTKCALETWSSHPALVFRFPSRLSYTLDWSRLKDQPNLFSSLAGRSFLVANAAADTHHIIFCSDGFCKMTGYTRAEVMQRSACTEFLHGPMTAQSAVAAVKEALIKGLEKHFEILYYRKNGESALYPCPF